MNSRYASNKDIINQNYVQGSQIIFIFESDDEKFVHIHNNF